MATVAIARSVAPRARKPPRISSTATRWVRWIVEPVTSITTTEIVNSTRNVRQEGEHVDVLAREVGPVAGDPVAHDRAQVDGQEEHHQPRPEDDQLPYCARRTPRRNPAASRTTGQTSTSTADPSVDVARECL